MEATVRELRTTDHDAAVRIAEGWLGEFVQSHFEFGMSPSQRPYGRPRKYTGALHAMALDTGTGLMAMRAAVDEELGNELPELPRSDRLAAIATALGLAVKALKGSAPVDWTSGTLPELIERAESEGVHPRDLNDEFKRLKTREIARRTLADAEAKAAMAKAAAEFEWTDLTNDWDADPVAPRVGARTDGMFGLYLGERNAVVGESESGKTWTLGHFAGQELRAGRPVVYLDFENGETQIRQRLRQLGHTKAEVKRLRYRWLDAPLPVELARKLANELAGAGGRLAVVDAMTEVAQALNLDVSGADSNAVETCYEIALDPWREAGCAAVMIDNTKKSSPIDQSGNQFKRSGIGGAVLAVVNDTPFGKNQAGGSRIYVRKDRPGGLDWQPCKDASGRLWGELQVMPDGLGGVSVSVTPPTAAPGSEEASAALATAADIIRETWNLAGAALRRFALTEVTSMRDLTERMGELRATDPHRWPNAHRHRQYIANTLADHAEDKSLTAEAGISVAVSRDRGGRRTITVKQS